MPELPVEAIVVRDRHRRDMGDLRPLAESIRKHGLLHPVVVRRRDKRLIAGERRLIACRDILRWRKIPVNLIDPSSLLEVERDENDCRKSLTLSEKVALAEAIREEIGERRGRPSAAENVGNCPQVEGDEKVGNCPHFEPGEKTRDAAARAAGFSSTDESRRAAKVVANGTPELVEAMDSGEVSPSAAAKIAALPPDEQRQAVEAIRNGASPADVTAPADEPEPPPLDKLGEPWPERALPALACLPDYEALIREFRKLRDAVESVKRRPIGVYLDATAACDHLRRAADHLKALRPYAGCPYCAGGARCASCQVCQGAGWVSRTTYENSPKGQGVQ